MKMVLITWVDSVGVSSEWEHKDSDPQLEVSEIRTIGFLWRKTKDAFTVVQSDSEDQVVGMMIIPKCAVKSIKYLNEAV